MSRDERYKQLKEGDPTVPSPSVRQENTHYFYDSSNPTKKLSLEWISGRKVMLLYSYFVSIELEVEHDINKMHLRLILFRIILHGFQLHLLYDHFMRDEPHVIKIYDARYIASLEDYQFLVIDAKLTSQFFDTD